MKKRFIGSIIYIFFEMGIMAQQGSISGYVVSEFDQSALPYGTITLHQSADSSFVTGALADSMGYFMLGNINEGHYILKLKSIAYQPKYVNIELTQGQNLDLSQITLTPSNELKEVVVNGEKALIENKIDKKVFNASESIEGRGGTGLDMMRAVPLVTVDQNDNILLRGDANVTVFIDGRPIAMPANEYLKQIPGSAIDKIEIITNPSAKYDPEGMSGIINVVLKKEKVSGFNGNINTSFGYAQFHKTNNSLSLNYRNKKLNISGMIGYSNRKVWYGGTLDRDVQLNDSVWDILRQSDYGERTNAALSSRIGVDYFVNDYNTFYVNLTGNLGDNIGNRLIDYDNLSTNGELLYFSEREGNIIAPTQSAGINGGWQKTFSKPGHTLDLDINATYFGMVADENLVHDYYGSQSEYLITQYQNTLENNKNNVILSKLDYVLPINDSTNLEAGFHYTDRQANNAFFSESGLTSNDLSEDFGISNTFNYQQSTYALYTTFSRQIKKLGIKLGVRAEQTYTDALLVNGNQNFKNDYFKLFPSAHLSYDLKNNAQIQLSYSKRINRPQMHQINPFTNYSDPLTLQTGNPFLLPEFIHVNEIGYMKYFKKVSVNATIYHRIITNLIRRNLSYQGTQSVVSFQNLGRSSLSGGDLMLTYRPVKGVRIMSTTSLTNTYTKDTTLTNGSPKQNFIGFNTRLNASAQLKKGWSLQLWASYAPKLSVLQGYILPNYGTGFGASKSILNNKGQLTLRFFDILKARRFGFEATPTEVYTFNSVRNWESRSVYLSFNYSFGKMIQGKEKRRIKNINATDDVTAPDMQ